MVRPAAFIPLGLNAPYLSGDLIAGKKARTAKMRSAKIKALTAAAAPGYMATLDRELRVQTAGIGLDILRIGSGIVIRIPAALTFATGSSAVKPEFDATLLEIARELKTHNQTYVDVFGHTDLSGTDAVNQALSDKRAAAVKAYLVSKGIDASRLESKGLGATKPKASNDTPEGRQTNRRVELVKQ